MRGRWGSLFLSGVFLAGCSTIPRPSDAASDPLDVGAIRNGRLDCTRRASDPEPDKQAYRFVADYVRRGGFIGREREGLSWDWEDMWMTIVPDFPPSYSDLPSIFVMVLGQCDRPPSREAQFFERVENPTGSTHWETEGGYPIWVYTMNIDEQYLATTYAHPSTYWMLGPPAWMAPTFPVPSIS